MCLFCAAGFLRTLPICMDSHFYEFCKNPKFVKLLTLKPIEPMELRSEYLKPSIEKLLKHDWRKQNIYAILYLLSNSVWKLEPQLTLFWSRCNDFFIISCYPSSVPKYLSPNSPMPGTTRKSSLKPDSISDVTTLSLGNLLQTTCNPWGAYKCQKKRWWYCIAI